MNQVSKGQNLTTFFDDCLKFKNTNIFESIFYYSKHTIFKKKEKEA